MNKYRERILSMGKETGARLVMPETHDKRIKKASQKLSSMGFQVLNHKDFEEKITSYVNYIQQQPFTENWPEENIREYINDPLHLAMIMVACDDADGLIAGAATSSSEVIRSAIRIVGINPASSWVSSIFLLISP